MIALIFNLALFVLLIIVIISEFKDKRKTNRLLRQESIKDDKFRERIIDLLWRHEGYYLVVIYWYDTKNFTHVFTYAKNGANAFVRVIDKYGGRKMPDNHNTKYAIINVKFLGYGF